MPFHAERPTTSARSTASDASQVKPVAADPTALRVVPVAGLVVGAGPDVMRRRAESDPLGGTQVSAELDDVLSRRQGRGEPLPAGLAQPMGEALGANLDAVRIHTGDEPAQLARSLQAQAFTRGADIYFGAGRYAPHTPAGQRLLAHELAHTVQPATGGGSGGPIIGRAADPAEAEADRVADGVMQVLRRKAIRHPDPPGPAFAAGARPAAADLAPLLRAQRSGIMDRAEPVRKEHDRPLDRLRRVTASSPDAGESDPAQRGSTNGWQHLRRRAEEQGPAARSGVTTVVGTGSTGRHTPIRRFFAVVREPQEGVEYERVGTVPYIWVNDKEFRKEDWVVSDVATGWKAYNLYEWSPSRIAAEIERRSAEAAVLRQQQQQAAEAELKLQVAAAEAKRKREEAAAEAERKQQELIAEANRQREEAEAAEAERVAAQQAEEQRVADEKAQAAAEKKRLTAERVAAENLAAAKRAEEKKRIAAEREATEKAVAAKKAEDKKKRAAEQEAADKKAAIQKAALKAEAQQVAAAREAAKQEKARQMAEEKRIADEKAAADREIAERLQIEQERLAAEAAKAEALLLAEAKQREREEQARVEEAAVEEARAKKAAKELEAQRKREEKARVRAEARVKAEAEARAKAEEEARVAAEARAKAEADERARIEAEEKASAEAKAAAEAEVKAKAEAAEKARAAVTGPSPDAKGSDAVDSGVVGGVVDPVASTPMVPVPLGADYDPLAFGADQKFGNEPFSFDITTEDPAVKAHLAGLFAGLKAETSKSKNTKITDLFAQPHFKVHKSVAKENEEVKKARTQAVKGPYPKLIRHGPIDKRLEAAPAFAEKYELRAAADTKTKSIIDKSTGEAVGVLLIGIVDAFAKTPAQPGRRQGLTKKHKLSEDATHILDNAGVPTRRFAYFETSRQQLMDGLGPSGMGALRGRYPRFREAMGLPSTLNQIDRNDSSVAQMYGGVGVVGADKSVTVPQDVMAHTHQYLGNGLNQRGISLASTKKEQVYSNDGDPFKSDDGVRIKVDLSLVPEDVILFNHYAEGGVGSRLAKNPAFPKGMLDPQDKEDDKERAYAYANSVVKNRELLLEKLQPEWIVELTDHLQDSMAGSSGPAGPLKGPGDAKGMDVDQLKAAVGFDAYERGRADVKAGNDKDTTLTGFDEKNYNLGWSTGNEEVLGAKAAKDDCRDFWAGFTAQPLPPRVPVAKTKRQMLREKAEKKSRPAPDVSTARAFGALSAEKIIDLDERNRLDASKPAWYVLAQLRFVKIGDKLFRPTMHDSFWLAWAAAMKTPPVVAASTVPRVGAEDPVLAT